MERTRLKSGDRQLVLAKPEPIAAEAREQTPTLMAGEAAGSQGAVQVWAPDRWRLWSQAIAWALVVMMGLWILLHDLLYSRDPTSAFGVAMNMLFLLIPGVSAYVTLRRPCYLTTDNAGIGIRLAGGGTRVLRWDDIKSIERKGSTLILLTTGAPCRIELCLIGYPLRTRREIEARIIERAELVHDQFTRQMLGGSREYPVNEQKSVKAPAEPKSLGSGD